MLTVIMLMTAVPSADIVRNAGDTKPLPPEKYLHVVSETDSPVQQVYIKAKDGLYIAAAIRKPKGSGPFPAIVMFHGAPGGRGMEQLVGMVTRRHRRARVGALSPGRLRRCRRGLPWRRHECHLRAVHDGAVHGHR